MLKQNSNIKKLAIKRTIKQVKKKISMLRKNGEKIDPSYIEECVRTLYEENLKKLKN